MGAPLHAASPLQFDGNYGGKEAEEEEEEEEKQKYNDRLTDSVATSMIT